MENECELTCQGYRCGPEPGCQDLALPAYVSTEEVSEGTHLPGGTVALL